MADSYETILLAAGSAKRFNHPDQVNKILMPLGRRPVFDYSLRLFIEDDTCAKIWLVINSEIETMIKEQVMALYKEMPGKIQWLLGGAERQDSVSRALSQLSCPDDRKILVHDAARPFISKELVERLVDKGRESVAVTLGIPAKDTMKRVREGKVCQSLFRPEIMHIQTPQLFDCKVLTEAMHQAEREGYYGNEETELVERLGYPVDVILGSDQNFKLTTAFDYRLAKMLKETGGSGN